MSWQIRQAARRIAQGGVVAYPTESVYGLGCDPLNPHAVMSLLALKNRGWEKGLIVVASQLEQLAGYIQPDQLTGLQQAIQSQSEPTSWLVAANPELPLWIRGKHDSVVIRVSRHPVIVDLCQQLKQPIISTSANPSNKPPANDALQVRRYFGNALDYILSSDTACNNPPSQILQFPDRRRIR